MAPSSLLFLFLFPTYTFQVASAAPAAAHRAPDELFAPAYALTALHRLSKRLSMDLHAAVYTQPNLIYIIEGGESLTAVATNKSVM
jgi:hypothetical protein